MNTSDLFAELYKTSFGTVRIYKDRSLNWYQSLAAALSDSGPGPVRVLDSKLLYFGPRFAESWRQRSRTVTALGDLRAEFEAAASRLILPNIGKDAVTLIDLGVGDFFKGYVLLDRLLRGPVRPVNYVLYDISYDMITLALDTEVPEFSAALRAVHDQHTLIAINAEFHELERYRGVLPAASQRCFGLFGNTLGGVADQGQLLRSISEALSGDDVFIAELQLLEAEPPSDAELLRRFARTKRFYVGPFLALGCPEAELDLEVRTEPSRDCETVNIICRVAKEFTARVETGENPEITVPEGEYCMLQIRKYRRQSLEGLFELSNLQIVDSYCTAASEQGERVFAYIAARKSTRGSMASGG